ncbi:DUF3455 domain-containing protein [Streptomyces caeni]|uniref:DUF3455 domain-containing protein n=1 Tax=Streptomyces caeni TaxID=2307231 RepID=A0ABW4IYF7_9ACTN
MNPASDAFRTPARKPAQGCRLRNGAATATPSRWPSPGAAPDGPPRSTSTRARRRRRRRADRLHPASGQGRTGPYRRRQREGRGRHPGTPQRVTPDGSDVTGTVLARTPNGDTDIPELDLKAIRPVGRHGLLADTAEILRLNTVGGVAPAGSCTPGTIAGDPYRADCVFVRC